MTGVFTYWCAEVQMKGDESMKTCSHVWVLVSENDKVFVYKCQNCGETKIEQRNLIKEERKQWQSMYQPKRKLLK